MREHLRKWWPVLKVILGLVVLFFVGNSLRRDLSEAEVWKHSFNPFSLVLAGVLYLLGLGCTMLFWGVLLRRSGQPLTFLELLRGYYIGLLGKYAPGKAWALVLRSNFMRNAKVNPAVAVQTGFYEVMMMMAGAGIVAGVLFAITGPDSGGTLQETMLLKAILMAVPEDAHLHREVLIAFALVVAVPILTIVLPPVFNRVVKSVTKPFTRPDAEPLPRIDWTAFLQGPPMELGCWLCAGASLCLTLDAVYPTGLDWNWATYAYVTAAIALACLAGFVILIVPSGLGVREYLLIVFLRPLHPSPDTALAVIVLRIVWTLAELIMAGTLYLTVPRASASTRNFAP